MSAKSILRSRLSGAVLATVLAACGAPGVADTVVLDPADAIRDGSIEYKWNTWVVWCGHKLCEGTYTWRFPESGRFRLVWKHVNQKCAGAPPYELSINDRLVRRDAVPKYGSCEGCTGANIRRPPPNPWDKYEDIELGTYRIRAGDALRLHVRNAFECGIEAPGAYAGFRVIEAIN